MTITLINIPINKNESFVTKFIDLSEVNAYMIMIKTVHFGRFQQDLFESILIYILFQYPNYMSSIFTKKF